jgi:NADH-quinone oxidoreductase subunit F
MEKILTKNVGRENSQSIDTYISNGGYNALKKAFEMTPDAVIEEVKKSGLRGRGGAGFPTGMKWSFMPKESPKPKVLVCNADESEPGTFKDRVIIERDPHQLIEGCIISSYAMGASLCYIYIRGEYVHGAKVLQKAIDEAYSKGFLGKNVFGKGYNLEMTLHRGAGAYICGEETGLLESLEGKRGWPRIKPPFPPQFGAFGFPTTVNNVETLSCVPHIIERGARWFAEIGPEKSPGPKLYCVSGHVKNPGVFELPMGTNLKEIIFEYAGGMRNGEKLKAVVPGGSSTPVFKAEEIDVNMDFESVAKAGSMLGSAGIIVMDESVCMVDTALNLAKFYAHESCGQCTPCREGTHWLELILDRIEHGKGRDEDWALIADICDNISFKTICPLGDAAATPINSYVRKFKEEFEYHFKEKKCLTS